ncbi:MULTISPECIES: PH domain-containing protein [Sutcliffiella]|uniref:YdbS-like PH domain-containing protein n=1 Tax=Sutcliffiella cohnii TaxID=33932 RepID=A0A223KXJ5_9BACI|nr:MULTISPECIES: PH domain-containing protein [Sutcliffiella]AST94124.1 hypothetical protein BC6307_24160 [Sutcliffiella cohnii]WBL15337.1 PH domain-containing protein [Sutcliffiella sp. NC1]
MMFERRRMHPAATVVLFIKQLKDLIVPFIFIFIFGAAGNSFNLFSIFFMIFGLLAALLTGVLQWLRYYYWVENGELRTEYGIFVRKRRFIPIERIQSIDTSAGIIQRLFRIVKLQVETAGGGQEADVMISAVTKEEAEELRNILLAKKKEIVENAPSFEIDSNEKEVEENIEVQEEITHTYRITWGDLLIVGTTSGGIGVVLSGVFATATQLEQFIPYERVFTQFGEFLQRSVVIISIFIFLVLFISWIISIGMTMIKYGNFTVVKREDEIVISRGIIEKRQMTIPLERIQAIRVTQNLLRQPLGFATVYVESAGSSSGQESDHSTILFPLLKNKDVSKWLHDFVPDYKLQEDVHPLPKIALVRYLVRHVVPAIVVSGLLAYFIPPYGYFALLLIPIAGVLAYFRYRDGGWKLDGDLLQLSFRIINKNKVILKKKRIQSLEWRESLFQRRQNVGTLEAAIKSSFTFKNFKVIDVKVKDGANVYKWYSYKK